MEYLRQQTRSQTQFLLDSAHLRDAQIVRAVEKIRAKPKAQHWCCVVCGNYVTDEDQLVRINGSSVHSKINPMGHTFRFRSFKQAEGCERVGQLTAEYSWYSGYTWQFAHCRRCQTQLGWYFAGPEPFFGLIEQQLKKCAEE
jgi:hypothetical protein